ncbi:MAG: tRNA (adenosine(37)-N6)-dimethylallyltransferase MiaA [Actinobacteria bacterium]|nr:tRNA (adenosine(37)-N6)-dimethylallyltransferase MiaA [Actinomycetota bacterium]
MPGAAGTRHPEGPPVVALFGATALGKTEVALALAERLGADIVVADSMQVYEGLAIVTNQPDEAQRARARHHLVGFVPPQAELTVAEYANRAHEVIDALRRAGRAAVVEGGSGLYLRAALGDLEFAAPPDAALRRTLEERWARDPGGVVDELRRRDPAGLARLDASNPRRVIRALEAVLVSGGPLPATARDQLWRPGERYPHALVALVPDDDREALKTRIEARVDEMLAAGAAEEVARARDRGPLSRTALQAIGVRELSAVLDGDLSLEQAAARMKSRTRALARRQLTWLRKLPAAAQVPAAGRPPEAVAAEVLAVVETRPW